ncbi:class I SAM-dependent methyltransferase [Nocardia sp. NPDC049149]|uniref:class I SAM-dependent methyltransferase n=1 Tax=Nocardia sp. NPDC049149 TaxID=3364315 RepID=UPI00371E5CBB
MIDPDGQQAAWDLWHGARDTTGDRSALAWLLGERYPTAGKLLELGCGQGADAVWFAQHGATVWATDISTVALDAARANAARHQVSVTFMAHDLRSGLPLSFDAELDAVYARLSLHYFSPEVTGQLFTEIAEALRPGGVFAFEVKSVDDPLFGAGEHVAGRMFRRNGRTRHFFTPTYVRALLQGWDIQQLTEHRFRYQSDTESAIIRVIAKQAEGAAR